RMEEVFRSLTDGIWSDLDKLPDQKDPKAAKLALSTVRRNLQREYLRRLGNMVLGDRSNPYSDMFSYIVIIGGGSSSVPSVRPAEASPGRGGTFCPRRVSMSPRPRLSALIVSALGVIGVAAWAAAQGTPSPRPGLTAQQTRQAVDIAREPG
ncbi:MAG TPA: hypothetical protein VKF17_09605, partial [Isosphaeraceae bacterium]|nr:hypothetical protein [Isosphaeraceae bacterium]